MELTLEGDIENQDNDDDNCMCTYIYIYIISYIYITIDMGYSGTMMMMMMVLLACLVGRSVVCLFVCSFIILEQYRVVGPSAFFDNKLLDGLLMCVDALLQV